MARTFCLPNFTHELRSSAWLAGFIDGEGSFNISQSPRGNCWPVLSVTQRDDDRRLMEQIADALGGSLQTVDHHGGGLPRNPIVHVKVINKAALLGVVAYFDAYPLRTKKAMEYVVWRGAVLAYVDEGGRSPILVEAKAFIESSRVYKGTDVSLVKAP